MVDWTSAVKSLGVATGRGIARGTIIIVDEANRRIKNNRRKRRIVDRMYPNVVKKLAIDKGLHPKPFYGGWPKIDDYKDAIVSNVSLKDLIEFANKKRILIRDIVDEINTEIAAQEEKRLSTNGNVQETYREVFSAIREFKPFKNYRREYLYQIELAQWLRSRFPDTDIEIQRGSSRPDIVVNGIAIEVKGPTTERELVTISDKCMRYTGRFKNGIIIVLFNVRVNSYRFYEEWLERIKKTYEHLTHIEVIRK